MKRKMPKCTDCKKPASITWDGVWLCKPCEKKRLKKIKQKQGDSYKTNRS